VPVPESGTRTSACCAGGYDVVLLETWVLHTLLDLLPPDGGLSDSCCALVAGCCCARFTRSVQSSSAAKAGQGSHRQLLQQQLVATDVAYSSHNTCSASENAVSITGNNGGSSRDAGAAVTVRLRQWTLGEVLTAAAAAWLGCQVLGGGCWCENGRLWVAKVVYPGSVQGLGEQVLWSIK